jgi:hypothetical protein
MGTEVQPGRGSAQQNTCPVDWRDAAFRGMLSPLSRQVDAARAVFRLSPIAVFAAFVGLALFAAVASAAPPSPTGQIGATPLSGAPAGGPDLDSGGSLVPRNGPEPGKRRAAQWITESEQAGVTQNCIGQYPEQLGMAWTGYYGEIGVSPQKNDVYYVEAGWGVSGNPCTGGAYVHDELVLPAHTQLAISGNNPVRCWYQGPSQGSLQEFTQDCPQSPHTGTYGGYAFDPPGNQAAWPTATGSIFEIWVPVKTSAPLSGLYPSPGQPCETCVYAGIWMIDGWNSPWVWPRQGVQVIGSGSASQPSITYPGPSTTNLNYNSAQSRIETRLLGNLFTEGTTGVAHFELGNNSGNSIPISSPGDYLAYEDWYMTPGRKYQWRLCYKPTGSPEFCGADQVFSAPPDTGIGNVTVKKRKRKATVDFASSSAPNMVVSFECKLDGGSYKPCTTPKTYTRLKQGSHTVSVRAVDQDGHKDSTPAKQSFKI